jgi:hypothetical protein
MVKSSLPAPNKFPTACKMENWSCCYVDLPGENSILKRGEDAPENSYQRARRWCHEGGRQNRLTSQLFNKAWYELSWD